MPPIACPSCNEQDDLEGARGPDGVLQITCGGCGTVWDRDLTRRCRLCGSANLRPTPRPLWEKGRGDQRTPAGRIEAYACNACDGRDVTSSRPAPAS